jgi:hypothetical protein
MERITKITLFALGLVVLLGLAGIAPGFPPLALVVQAATEETLTLDVAIDCRTFNFNRGISPDQVVRGASFIANGKIFRAGTLLTGARSNDPNAPGSIGAFIEHGTMAATIAEIVAGKRPAFVATWLHVLNDGRGIVADGPHPDSGPMAVVDGMGGFSGASGEVAVNIIGTNSTGCPNVRSTFHLKKQGDN